MSTKNTYFSDVIPYLVAYHETFGNLPTPVIECSKSGQAFTCFGTNLSKKIEKAGGIEKLLRNFVGRGVQKKQAVKAKIEKRTSKKVISIKAQDLETAGIELQDLTPVTA
jgi:hypothetical protein